MESPAYIVLSRQLSLRRQLDVVAHNLANTNTPGFKGEKMVFEEFLTQPQRNVPLSFVQDVRTVRDLSEGPLARTDNPLDLAIAGEGYFTVQTESGPRYTRAGRFQIDAEGQLTDNRGNPLLGPGGQPVTIPGGSQDLSITPDGTVSAGINVVGTVGVVQFADPQALQPEGGNQFTTDQAPQPAPKARILQGMLENSNVNPVLELTEMIRVHRAYAGNQNILQNEHDRIRRAITRLTGQPNAS
jgi:flagellar basal-body rod protein FlgF